MLIGGNSSAVIGSETISGELDLTGEQTDTSTGTVNNFALTAGVSVLRCNPASALTVTGITGGTSGRLLIVVNESTASTITITNEGAGSTAANRLTNLSNASTSVTPLGAALLRYDNSSSRWRVLFASGSTVNAAITFGAAVNANGSFIANSTVTASSVNNPTSLSGSTNDWAPTLAYRQRIAASANATVTGLAMTGVGISGRLAMFQNISAFNITLTNEDSGSTAANRFTNPNSSSVVLPPNASCYLIYDTTTSRWITIPGAGCTVTQTVFAGATQADTSTGTVNDFALSASATILRFNNASGLTLTGITGGVDGRLLIVLNVGSSSVTLNNESGSSTAANRISAIGGGTCTLQPGASGNAGAILIYDGTSSRWRVVSQISNTLGGLSFTGTVTMAGLSTTGNTRLGDQSSDLVGFYTTAGVAQASIVALTDNTTGTANDTLEALTSGTVYSTDVAAIRNNFADLAAKINALRTILVNLGITT